MNIEQAEEVRKLSAKLGKTKQIYRDQCIRDCQCVQTVADFPAVFFLVLSWNTNENPSADKLSRAINYPNSRLS